MQGKHLNENELSTYLAGKVAATVRSNVEAHLKICGDCFQNYMHMREAIFLQKGGEKITPRLKATLIEKIRMAHTSHIAIFVRFLKDTVTVVSGDQDSLQFQGLKATYAFRSGDDNSVSPSQEGPISIARIVDGREVTLTLYPLATRDKVGLSLRVQPNEALTATIFFDGEECETIRDISAQAMLKTELPKQGALDIRFSRGSETLFTIALNLESGV